MLTIIRALKKWWSDLLGSHFTIYTNHQTLQNFDIQKELSKRQARWMEYMSQYDCSIKYINEDDNCVADALSCLPNTVDNDSSPITSIFEIQSDPFFVQDIKDGYHTDPWCRALMSDLAQGVTSRNGLIFIMNQLIIPKHKQLCEDLFRLAHDNLGHFSSEKSYSSLQNDFYWPNM